MDSKSILEAMDKEQFVECPRCGDFLEYAGDLEVTDETAFEVRWAECPSCGWESVMEHTGNSWPASKLWKDQA